MTKQREAVNVGIDVGKAQLDVCLLERNLKFAVANEERAIPLCQDSCRLFIV